MWKFDLMDTVAGRQLYDMGREKEHQEWLQKELISVRDMLLDALEARFELVPHKMIDQIHAINQVDELKSLFKEAIRCPNIGSFKERLSS